MESTVQAAANRVFIAVPSPARSCDLRVELSNYGVFVPFQWSQSKTRLLADAHCTAGMRVGRERSALATSRMRTLLNLTSQQSCPSWKKFHRTFLLQNANGELHVRCCRYDMSPAADRHEMRQSRRLVFSGLPKAAYSCQGAGRDLMSSALE